MEKLACMDGRPGVLGSDLVSIRHTMPASGLFTNEALRTLIEDYPRRFMSLAAPLPGRSTGPRAHAGEIGNVTATEILDALPNGQYRLELQDLERHAPAYGELIAHGFGDVERATPHLRTFGRRSTLVVTSPNVAIPCRAAFSVVCKWQVRGRQRFYFYGMSDDPNPLSEARRETLMSAARSVRVSFAPGMRTEGLVYSLGPGMAVSWPLNMPHRIENDEELSVAIVSEFVTPQTKRTRDIYLANGFLRRRLGVMPRSTSTEGLSALFKRGLAAAVIGFGGHSRREVETMREIEPHPPHL